MPIKRLVPLVEIGARPKGVASFASKSIKKNKYREPLKQMTDLVGARVIVHLQSEVEAVCRWIEDTFEIDRANSGSNIGSWARTNPATARCITG